jgi:phosphonate transport system permease protein
MKQTSTNQVPRVPDALAGLLSLIVPGLGQIVTGRQGRGLAIMVTIAAVTILTIWRQMTPLWIGIIILWLWAAWDAFRARRQVSSLVPTVVGILLLYVLGWSITEINLYKMSTGMPSIVPVIKALTQPDLITRPTEEKTTDVRINVPCVPGKEQAKQVPHEWPAEMTLSVPCAQVGDQITVKGRGFQPNLDVELWWINSIGEQQQLTEGGKALIRQADAEGNFEATFIGPQSVPLTAQPGPGETQTHSIEARQYRIIGGLRPSQTFYLVASKMGETIAQALMATILAVFFAVPVSFFAARNLMGGNPATVAVYYVIRTFLNIMRSIEPLILCIIFVVAVGLGPFPGVLALAVHSIAALGKLYSESIESIDPGPIEAITATGANRLQTIVFAVVPQIIPSYLAFTLYRWDINVRMSTIIGFVGGGGVGFLLTQWIRLSKYREAGAAILAIAIVVAVLDYISAVVRERIE